MPISALTLYFTLLLNIAFNIVGNAQPPEKENFKPNQIPQIENILPEKLSKDDCAWAWEQLEIENAHRIVSSANELPGHGIKIAHIDTGIIPFPALQSGIGKPTHPTVVSAFPVPPILLGTFNFVQLNLPALDNNPKAPNFGHGTETASLIVGSLFENNVENWPFQGVAIGAQIISIKVTDSVVMVGNITTSGTADLKNLAHGIRLATKLGVNVMTISLGALFDKNNLISDAVRDALNQGIIIVAAAGQVLPIDLVPLPASLPGVVSVTASTRSKEPWQYAFSGKNISWAAPGENVCHFSIDRNARLPAHPLLSEQIARFDSREGKPLTLRGLVRKSSGTSYSTAFAAGAAALWLQHHSPEKLSRNYGQKNISTLFHRVAQSLGVDRPADWNTRKHGTGILNIRKLLEAPLPCDEHDDFEICSVKFRNFLRTTSR